MSRTEHARQPGKSERAVERQRDLDDDVPPWERREQEDALRQFLGADARAGGVDVEFIRRVQALPEREGRIYDALCARASEPDATPEEQQAFRAAREQVRRSGRLVMASPRSKEIRVPKEVQEQIDFLVCCGVPPKDCEPLARGELFETPSLEAVREMAGPFLVLCGDRGTGKSVAAGWWLLNVKHYRPNRTAIRTTGRRFAEADVIHKMTDQQLSDLAVSVALVVDDLGVPASDYDDRTMSTLLTRRYRNGLDTVVTTNLSPADFITRYGDRVYDRVVEAGAWVSVGTESLRGKERP